MIAQAARRLQTPVQRRLDLEPFLTETKGRERAHHIIVEFIYCRWPHLFELLRPSLSSISKYSCRSERT